MMYPYSYSYEYYYTGRFTFLVIAILAAVILSIVLYFTFLNKRTRENIRASRERYTISLISINFTRKKY